MNPYQFYISIQKALLDAIERCYKFFTDMKLYISKKKQRLFHFMGFKSINNECQSTPVYRERVDFKELIGYYIQKQNPTIQFPTTEGIIHYGKGGAHIIPACPNVAEAIMKTSNENLLISAMGSLCGAITPNLRKASVALVENTIVLHLYYAKSPSEEEIDLSECAASEIVADFPAAMIDCQIEVVEMPTKITVTDLLVYSRYEPSIKINE